MLADGSWLSSNMCRASLVGSNNPHQLKTL